MILQKYEAERKLIHFSGFLLIILYWALQQGFGRGMALLALITVLFLLLIYEHLRLVLEVPVPFKSYIREHEKKTFTAATYFVLAAIICLAFFDFKIALIALSMTILGEIVAVLVGERWRQHMIPKVKKKKSWEGTMAEFATNLIVGFIIWPYWPIFLPMAIVATLAEVITFKVDDNLIIPIVTGLIG